MLIFDPCLPMSATSVPQSLTVGTRIQIKLTPQELLKEVNY